MASFLFLGTSQIGVSETAGTVFVPVVRTGDLTSAIRIEYGVTPDTATSDVDFVQPATTLFLEIPAGESTGFIAVDILNDAEFEETETFAVSLISADALTPGETATLLAPRTANIDILDDENPVVDPPIPPLVSDYSVTETVIASGLDAPVALEWGPQAEPVLYVVLKTGAIEAYDAATNTFIGTVLDIKDRVNSIQDRGLLDIALHPDLENNPYLYAFYVVDPPETQGLTGNAGPDGAGNRFAYVSRYTLDAATDYTTIVEDSEVILIGGAGQSLSDLSGAGAIDSTSDIAAPSSEVDPLTGLYKEDFIKVDSRSHAGGGLAFGPDGALYVAIGDGASFDQIDPRAVSVQDLTSLSGKILRVDPITGDGLPDNPFVEPGLALDSNQAKVYQLGSRNPFAITFSDDGRLFISETGWYSWEEINSGPAGANYGWPFYEGGDNGVALQSPYANLPEAIAFYQDVANGLVELPLPGFRAFSHDNADPGYEVQAIVGASAIYTGDVYPAELANTYFFTDVSQGEIFAVDINDSRNVTYLYTAEFGFGPVHFNMGPDGYIYIADLVTNTVKKLEITYLGPVALDDAAVVTGTDPVVIDVLANDTPPDGAELAIVSVTQGAFGVVAVDDNGTPADTTDDFVVYTPGAAFAGSDSFSYTISDGEREAMANVAIGTGGTSLIAFEDFETGAVGWTSNTTTDGGAALTQFLGRFGVGPSPATQKTFALPAGVTAVTLSFDFYEIDSWDGTGGWDFLNLTVNDTPVFMEAFQHANLQGVDAVDAGVRTGSIPGMTWTITPVTDGGTSLGFGNLWYQTDQIHHVEVVIDNPGTDLKVGFGSTLGSELADESYGIDNVRIVADGVVVDLPPTAVADVATTLVDTPVAVAVLANDSDPEGAALSIVAVENGLNGLVAINDNGTPLVTGDDFVVYTPNAGFNGPSDQFSYTISDGANTATATVSVTVGSEPVDLPPTAVADVATTLVGTPVAIAVLANDSDPEGAALSIVAAENGLNGLVAINDNGTPLVTGDDFVVYTPNAGFTGPSDQFSYIISDGANTATATVTVAVNTEPVDLPPTAVADVAATLAGTPVAIAVLANDSDPEGAALSIVAAGNGLNGLVTIDDNGTPLVSGDDFVVYTPNAGFTGPSDQFSYTISDGTNTASATVDVTVNSGTGGGVIAFEDFETGAVGWTSNTTTDGGAALTQFLGRFGVGPNPATQKTFALPAGVSAVTLSFDFYEIDSWDGTSGWDFLNLTINDTPVFMESFQHANLQGVDAVDAAVRTGSIPGMAWTITPVTDGGSSLGFGSAWYQTDQIHHVEVVIENPGASLTVGFGSTLGSDLTDKSYGIDNVRIVADGAVVDLPPTAVADVATTLAGTPVAIAVLANDSDPEGAALSIVAAGNGLNGVVTIDDNGTPLVSSDDFVVYTPNAGFTGPSDQFSYTISDGTNTASATVDVTVNAEPVDLPPTAVADVATTLAGTPVAIAVLANDSDPEGAALSIVAAGNGLNGVVTIDDNGTPLVSSDDFVVYTPNAGFTGPSDQFSYTISDGTNTASATVDVTVNAEPVDLPPTAVADVATTLAGTPVAIAVLANDSDPEGAALSIVAAGNGLNGVVTIDDNGTPLVSGDDFVVYTPNAGFTGPSDQFSYTISDGTNTASATVDVTVNAEPVDLPPTAVADVATTLAGTPVAIAVLANDSDPESAALSIVAAGNGLNGVVTIDDNGTPLVSGDDFVVYTPNAGFTGPSDQFSYTISDGTNTASATVSVSVSDGTGGPVLVAAEDFEGGAIGWSSNTTTDGGAVLTEFLGRFGVGGDPATQKTFALPAGSGSATLSFDFYEIDSWDGTGGWDFLNLTVNDTLVFMEAFQHANLQGVNAVDAAVRTGIAPGMSWTITPVTSGGTSLGFGSAWYQTDQIHHVEVVIDDPGASLKVEFASTLGSELSDESYGIDNLQVYADLLVS